MPQPRLQNPLWVRIAAVSKATSAFDRDTRQPIREVEREAVRIRAQVRHRALAEPEYHATGLDEDLEGWITVRVVDCARLGYEPKVGDRITAMGKRTVNFFVRALQDEGHYSDVNTATLIRLYFEDRRPATATPRAN